MKAMLFTMWLVVILLIVIGFNYPQEYKRQNDSVATEFLTDNESALMLENQDLLIEINYLRNANLELLKVCQ